MANTAGDSNITKLVLTDYIDDPITKLYSIIVDVIVVTTLVLAPFYFYLIIKKSKATMKNYRLFLLFYTAFTSLITISFGFARPGLIIPLSTSYPMGWIPNLPKVPTLISFVLSYIAGSITTDMLMLALIQRYFNASDLFINHNKFLKIFCYLFILITNIVNNIFSQTDQLQCLLPSDQLNTFFAARLDRPNDFLSKYSYVAVSYCSTSFTSPTYIFNLCIWITRFIGFGIILYKNITFAKRFAQQIGYKTAKFHKMLIKAVITQILCCIICTRLPLLMVFIVLQTKNLLYITIASYIYLIALCSLPLVDMLITVYFVAPYRKYVLQKVFRKSEAENSVTYFVKNVNHTSTIQPP